MKRSPKRRKHPDNPYTLLNNKDVYQVSFKDSEGKLKIIEISQELYNAFSEFELQDISEMHEYERHTEHSEIYEYKLNDRVMNKPVELDDEVIQNSTFENLKKAIEKLPKIQRRRIKKYYFEDKNINQIAKEENATKQAVSTILERAIKNLKKILEKNSN